MVQPRCIHTSLNKNGKTPSQIAAEKGFFDARCSRALIFTSFRIYIVNGIGIKVKVPTDRHKGM